MFRWYLVHTKPSGESVAQANLERQGYEVYLPRLLRSVRGCGRVRDRIVALFPRYLFLRLADGLQSLAPVRSSVGVSGVVMFGTRYAVVPDSVVRSLRAHADPETGFHRLSARADLAPGAAVRIAGGAFDGLEGIFERADGSDRVVVLLSLLGRQTAVRLPLGFIASECVV